MRTNKDVVFPYFNGNIKLTKVEGHINLDQFIRVHRNPKLKTVDILHKVAEASKKGDQKLKRELKQQLATFTPSVNIEVGGWRRYSQIASWTGLMQMDFDGIESFIDVIDLKNLLFDTYKEIVCCYVSPSRKGVKALLRTVIPTDAEHYKAMHKAVQVEMEQYSYFDVATKNAVLPLFLGWDQHILWRDYSECEEWSLEDRYEIPKVQLLSKPNFIPTSFSDREYQYYYDKCIRIFTDNMAMINDSGHPQLRTNCLILGSRAGAGYITLFEAKELAISCIKANPYFSKGEGGYMDTANWAIEQGSKSPKYYK